MLMTLVKMTLEKMDTLIQKTVVMINKRQQEELEEFANDCQLYEEYDEDDEGYWDYVKQYKLHNELLIISFVCIVVLYVVLYYLITGEPL